MHAITRSNEQLFRSAFQKICSGLAVQSLVDIGGWDGTNSLKIGKLVGAKTVVCVDHDVKALRHAAKLGCKTVVADLNQPLKLRSNTYQLVLSNQVIEHIAKTDLVVSETFRILKPGGSAIWCTPNLASWHNIAALAFGYQPFSSQISDEVFIGNPWHPDYNKKINEAQAHLRVFTRKSLTDLLEHHGFIIDKTVGVGYYPLGGKLAQACAMLDPVHAAYILIRASKPN